MLNFFPFFRDLPFFRAWPFFRAVCLFARLSSEYFMGVYPLFFFSLHLFYSHHFFAGLLHRWPSQACWLLLASGSLFWPYLPQAKINNPGGSTALPKKHQQVSKKNQACGWRSSICTGACSGRAGSLLMLPAFSTGLACKEEIKKAKWQQKLDTHLV